MCCVKAGTGTTCVAWCIPAVRVLYAHVPQQRGPARDEPRGQVCAEQGWYGVLLRRFQIQGPPFLTLHLWGLGPPPATSAQGLGPPRPHLHRDWAHPCHIYTGTGPAPATSAPGLRPTPGHICNGTGWPTVCCVCGRCQARTKRRARAQAQPPNITITTAQATALARFASASEDARMPSRLVAWHAA